MGSSPVSDTKKREGSRYVSEEVSDDHEEPGQSSSESAPSSGSEESSTHTETMNTTAQAMHKERLVAALRPVATGAISPVSPTLLSQLRPISLPQATKWTHGLVRLDGSGRVRDAVLFRELGWLPGDQLSLSIEGARLIIRQDKTGNTTLDTRGRLTLGESARRVLHLDGGASVLLSADLCEGFLVIHSAQRCDEVLTV